ncbi:MAG: DUF4352 domain-containing protein [Lachnospiraceae bacterium]|nr:DUF4352 domain-containing protein [Lachnospiraceae bacterium]
MKKITAMMLIVTMLFSLTGCGAEQMVELTDDERTKIVQFSAHVIGEFNKSQPEGYRPLNKNQIDKLNAPEEETKEEETNTEEAKENSSSGTSEAGDTTSTEKTVTLTEALGISGIKATVSGYKVRKDYVKDNVFAMSAAKGNKYIVMNVKIKNTGSSKVKCNILKKNLRLKLDINNGEGNATALTTLLPNDFSTYNGSVKAGKTVKTVLVFEVPEQLTKSISELKLQVVNDEGTQTILIN